MARASKVIMGGEDIGPDRGYGPAQLLKPAEVKAIAHLLEETTPDMLRKRFKPKEMTRADVYPGVIWERDGDKALSYVLDYYKRLVAFYTLAASRGQAVLIAAGTTVSASYRFLPSVKHARGYA